MPGRKSHFDWNIVYKHLEERGVKESSAQQQLSQIRRVLVGLFPEKTPTLSQVKRSVPAVLEWIQKEGNLPNYASQKNHMTSMYALYKALGVSTKKMKEPFDKIVELSLAERSGAMSKKNQEKFDKVDFKKIKEEIATTEDDTIRLLKALYSGDMPILRGQDWRGLKVLSAKRIPKKDLPANYLHLPSKTLHISEGKSLGAQASKEVDVPDSILNEIKRYMEKKETDVLFEGLLAPAMTKKMNKSLGYSIQALRKRYVSERMKQGISPAERAKLARIMGHSLITSVIDYSKPDALENMKVEMSDDED